MVYILGAYQLATVRNRHGRFRKYLRLYQRFKYLVDKKLGGLIAPFFILEVTAVWPLPIVHLP